MDPLDKALQAKEAGLGTALGWFGKGLSGQGSRNIAVQQSFGIAGRKALQGAFGDAATGALAAAGAAAMAGVISGARKLLDAGGKRREFLSMMEQNPDLQEAQSSNPKFFNASYNSIRSLNPTYGKDPIVAGSLMRRMMQSPESAGTILMSTMKSPSPGGSEWAMEVSGGPTRFRQL